MRQAVAHTLYIGEGISMERVTNQSQGPSPEAWESAYSFIIQKILPRLIKREIAAGRLAPPSNVVELKV